MFEPFHSAYIAFGKVAPIEVSEYPPNALADIFAFQVIVGGLVFSGLAHFTNPLIVRGCQRYYLQFRISHLHIQLVDAKKSLRRYIVAVLVGLRAPEATKPKTSWGVFHGAANRRYKPIAQ